MKISTKYVVEFYLTSNEIIAVCDTIGSVREYLKSRLDAKDTDLVGEDGYIFSVSTSKDDTNGTIRVRKIDFVEE
jgi:hypothetical protein